MKTAAENQFETYLRESGVDGHEDHQPDLGGGPGARRPDYRVTRAEAAAIIELKGFETSSMEDALARGGGVVIRDASQELAPVRNKIGEALKQLRPYRDRPEPLIVCLANPRRLMVPSESHNDVIAAMYGERGVRVSMVTPENPEPSDDPEWFLGRNGVFGGGLHPYVSAVMTLHERTYRDEAIERWHQDIKERLAGVEDRQERISLTYEATREPAFAEADATPGTYRFVRVFETHHVGATAPPVPRDLFTGPRDEFRAYNPENGCLELLRPPGRRDAPDERRGSSREAERGR
ncbi:MAG TPA: hypothetical protein VJL81_09750 [Solirubrobacterales bacterium]|nr:hypothetical protein [Solirubrobacterales bacterium]